MSFAGLAAHRRRHPGRARRNLFHSRRSRCPSRWGPRCSSPPVPLALPNRTLFSWRPVVYVGLISYPLYLWHWPPLSFLYVMDLNEGTAGRLLRIGAVIFAARRCDSHLPPGRGSNSPAKGPAPARRAAARWFERGSRRGTSWSRLRVVCLSVPRCDHNPFDRGRRCVARIAARGSTVSPNRSTRTPSAFAMTTRMNPRS